MAGTRWAAQLAYVIGVLLLLAPAALWVGLLGPFHRRHHPLPPAARRHGVEARLREGGWLLPADNDGAVRSSMLSLDRGLELALLTEELPAGSLVEGAAPICEWDGPWLHEQLTPALEQLRPLVRLGPVTSRLVPPAPLLPPGLGESAVSSTPIPTSALGTLSAHLDEAVLGPPGAVPQGHQAPLRLVVACPPLAGQGRQGAALSSFVEDGPGGSKGGQGTSAAAVTIDGWGGVLLLAPGGHQSNSGSGQQRVMLSEAAHVEVVAFAVRALRRWVLGDGDEDSGARRPLLPLAEAERRVLVARASKARAREALDRLRVLQEVVIGGERPLLTPVPRGVARDFDRSLSSLERLVDALAARHNATAVSATDEEEEEEEVSLLGHASAALRAARRAEADPGLLASPHLPFEHYAATLLPLLIPVLLPLVVGVAKERKRLLEKRGGAEKRD